MQIFINAFLIVLLTLVFFQDLRYRAIHISLPILICILGGYVFFFAIMHVAVLAYNIMFLFLTFGGLFIYMSIKNRKATNLLSTVGLGDFLFFASITPFFSTQNFILFFIAGMLFTIIVHTLLTLLPNYVELVPLAGLMAVFMIMIKVIFLFLGIDLLKATLV